MALCAGAYTRGTPVETLLGGTHPCYPGVRQWTLVHPDRRWVAPRYRMTRRCTVFGSNGGRERHSYSDVMGVRRPGAPYAGDPPQRCEPWLPESRRGAPP